MAKLTVTIRDAEVRTRLSRAVMAVQNLPAKVVRAEMDAARDELRAYPPELPNQRYQRTGRRYEATVIEAQSGNNASAKAYALVSDPRYPGGRNANPYVVGDAYGRGQAAVHVGRWKLLRTVVESAMSRIVERGAEYFRAVLERNGAP